jgi:apolipoprotein D and lipocalin family protein
MKLFACGALAMAPTLAVAAAPQAVQSVPPGMYSGRWYQIAQILKVDHHPCRDGVDEYLPSPKGGFTVNMSCPGNFVGFQHTSAHGEVTPGSGGAKFKLSFLGGFIRQEYWVVDLAPDQSWFLMATPGGNYLWLMARKPTLDAAAYAMARTRIQAMGYDVARLTPDR